MLLAIDIGNTSTVAGVFDGSVLAGHWRIATDPRRMPDEYAVLATVLFRLARLRRHSIDGAIIAGVVPEAQTAVREAVLSYLRIEPMVVSTQLDLGIPIRYDPPTGVGADRIANAVAATEQYGAPAIVADFGTGTNFDVIDRDGAYIGGAIAPGLELSMAALFAGTAQLPRVPLVAPAAPIGTTTIEALQSGILYGYAGLVDGLVERIQEQLGGGATVIATGGLAPIVAPHTRSIQHVSLNLTLYGLLLIYRKNRPDDRTAGARES